MPVTHEPDSQTLLYIRGAEHMIGPAIEGFGCRAHAWGDVFQERDDAWELLARIADGLIDEESIMEEVMEFFEKRGWGQTYGTLINEDA